MRCHFSEDGGIWQAGTISTSADLVHVASDDRKSAVAPRKPGFYFRGRTMAVTGYQQSGDAYRLLSPGVVFAGSAVPKREN